MANFERIARGWVRNEDRVINLSQFNQIRMVALVDREKMMHRGTYGIRVFTKNDEYYLKVYSDEELEQCKKDFEIIVNALRYKKDLL